jgi:hypothetical protein
LGFVSLHQSLQTFQWALLLMLMLLPTLLLNPGA